MSTRCQIVTLDSDGSLYPVKIYKHSDGYPEGVMDVLVPFAKAFAAGRGCDPEYWIAQCVGAFSQASGWGPGRGHFTGWGLSTFWHDDIEYLYIVSHDGTIRILRPDMTDDLDENTLPGGKEVQL